MLFFYAGLQTDVSLLAGIFSGTISLGTAIIALLILGVTGWFATKNKALESSQNASGEWRDNYLAERQLGEDKEERAAKLLVETNAAWQVRLNDAEARYTEQRELKHSALSENAALKMATDLTLVMRELAETKADLLGRMNAAEERIAKQMAAFATTQQKQTDALEAIVKRLNGTH